MSRAAFFWVRCVLTVRLARLLWLGIHARLSGAGDAVHDAIDAEVTELLDEVERRYQEMGR